MRLVMMTLAAVALTVAAAQARQGGVRVAVVRVLATDPEALAAFYEKSFGMSETLRPVDTPTTKEILINTGATPDAAKRATTSPIAIFTRPQNAPAGAMASLILEVPSLETAIQSAIGNGGTLLRPAATLGAARFAFLKDPDGNQIELLRRQSRPR